MNDVKLQLQALLPASIRHRLWIDDLPIRLHELPAQTLLMRPDGLPQRVYFVAKGWLRGSTALSDDVRPIGNVSIRGDAIGLSWLDQPNHLEAVETITPCDLISLPSEGLKDWMRRDHHLQDFVREELVREVMNLRMMAAVIGHMKAPDRLAYFLYVLLQRHRRTYQTRMTTLTLPLTQQEIGRILGLTNVSVNRAYRALETDGLIQTGRQSVTFIDEADFEKRFSISNLQPLVRQLVGANLQEQGLV